MRDAEKRVKVINQQGPAGLVFIIAYVGAAVYFVHQSHGFWPFIWALIKAAAWPGILVYHILGLLHV